MKNLSLILFIILWHSTFYAQKTTTSDVLKSAVNDERFQANQQIAAFAQGLRYHQSLIRKAELRLGLNGNALRDSIYGTLRNEDFYGVMLTTNSLLEIKKQKLLKQAQVNLLNSERQILEQQALFDRYQSLVVVAFSQKLRIEQGKLGVLLDKKHDVLKNMLDNGLDIKVKDVLDTEDDKNALQLELSELDNAVRLSQGKWGQFLLRGVSDVDFSDFISVSKIAEVVAAQKLTPSVNPVLDYRKSQNAYALAQYDWQWAQDRQIFSFLQLGYNNPIVIEETPRRLNPNNNYSLRFGLTLPIPNNNSPKRSEALLEQREAASNLDVTTRLNQKNVDIQYFKLENLLKQHRLCLDRIEQSLVKKMLSNDKLLAQITPLELLELRLSQQKLEVRALEIAQDITTEYIRLLDLNGALSAKPLKNYLSAGLMNF
jgi:hypothetical protein